MDRLRQIRYELNVRTATEVLRTATARFAPGLTMATGVGVESCLPGEDARAGRWRSRDQKACGLHVMERASSAEGSERSRPLPDGPPTS